MSTAQNKAFVRGLLERLGGAGGWLAVHPERYAPNAIVHFPGMPPLNYASHEQWGNSSWQPSPTFRPPLPT
jgi:hypothetical protein